MGKKIAVITLGCEKNTVDSEVIGGMLARRGFRLERDAERADTVIVNTCGFIDHAKKESIGAILEAVELKKQGAIRELYVAGCLSERYRSELESEIPEVDRFFGTQDFERILKTLEGSFSSPKASTTMRMKETLLGKDASLSSSSHLSSFHQLERKQTTSKPFAYLKISEGCDHPCAFCAIPIMRGGHRSRGIEELEFETMMLGSNGPKELVLIAQDSTNYGLDLYGERSIAKLMTRLARIPSIAWIRLMYAYPAKFPLDLLDVMAASSTMHEGKIVPYLDLPVQHASTAVLKSMRRGITRRATEELIATIRERVPGIALRTTLITGFPTEGEREFEELEEFVEQMQFDRLGVFTYSHEEGTTAYPLGDPIPEAEKRARQARLYDIQAEVSEARNLAKIGTVENVLIERTVAEDGRECYYGRTTSQAPEVDGEVRVTFAANNTSRRELAIGDFVRARITGLGDDMAGSEYELEAEVV
jgi:ribosomal protein S12 methylthiotransferase